MDPSGLQEWLLEAAKNPLLILLGIIVVRLMVYQHNQNRTSLYDLSRKLEKLAEAMHDLNVSNRTTGERIIAAIDRASTTVRTRRIMRDEDDTR